MTQEQKPMTEQYVPYGPEWEKEMSKFPKLSLIKMLGEELKKTEQASKEGWIDVESNVMPEVGQSVMVIIKKPDGGFYLPFSCDYLGNGDWGREDDEENGIGEYSDTITHWQPLPAPPQSNTIG